jgi:hypothetical protein
MLEGICTHLKPDAILHHDDWGGEKSTFMSPNMFADFFVEPYKQIYKYCHDHGVELVVHHADSYAATLVPYMMEMGIVIWQGCMESNNVPELIKKYGGQITFMGDIDNKSVDSPAGRARTAGRRRAGSATGAAASILSPASPRADRAPSSRAPTRSSPRRSTSTARRSSASRPTRSRGCRYSSFSEPPERRIKGVVATRGKRV